jgi:ABC-type multidrug transport system permease subunit
MPQFVTQRALYEARERPAKTYAWPAFILANVIVELPYCLMMAVILYFTWAYPIGYYKNAIPTDAVHERGALLSLFVLEFLLFSSTFAHFVVAAMDTAETAGNIANLMFSLCLIFCGVLATPSQFPG